MSNMTRVVMDIGTHPDGRTIRVAHILSAHDAAVMIADLDNMELADDIFATDTRTGTVQFIGSKVNK